MFEQLLNMSISASWVVLAVIMLRLVLKKAPKAIHCALWILVAIRLVLPMTIESDYSLMVPEKTEAATSRMMDDYVGGTHIYWDITAEYDMALDAGILPVQAEGGGSYVVTGTTPFTEPTRLADVLETLWIFGMAAMGLYALVSYLAVERKVRVCIKLDKTVRLCDYIDTPFILGIIRPKIYLPSELDPMTAGYVLAHEQAHLKRRDHWWKPLGFLLLSIHWFNPVLWLAYILLCRDIEQACDEKVVQTLDTGGKKAYSMALLQCSVSRRMIAACPLAFGEVGVKSRIKSVLRYKKPAFWVVAAAILASAAAAVCFLTDPKDSGPSAYEITSDLWIYDAEDVDVTVWDDGGSHGVNLSDEQIQDLCELIHDLNKDEFVKEKPEKHLLYAVLKCKDFDIELHWDGEYAYFTFDSATEEGITGNRRSVKNEELNAFLAEVAQQEYRLAEGTYVPIEAASLYSEAPDVLELVQNRRYEVTEDGLTVTDLGTGDVIAYVFDWCWEGLEEARKNLDSFMLLNYHSSFVNVQISLDDTGLKYQHLFDNCHVILQDETLYWIDGREHLEDGRINWTIYKLTAYTPYLIPPATHTEFFKKADKYSSYATAYIRSGDCRPGHFGLTDEEMDRLSTILAQMPEESIQPGGKLTDYYVTLSVGTNIHADIYCDAYFWYYGGEVGMYWRSYGTDGTQLYQIDYAPLSDFLESLMRPERIEFYSVGVKSDGILFSDGLFQYTTYTHGDISISLVNIIGWEYEIVPYVDDQTDFGIRCKPEWMDDWLFFGYRQGELVPESTFLREGVLGSGMQGWHYLFEDVLGEQSEGKRRLCYRYANGGTYYIYNGGDFDETLSEHDRGGYRFIEDSFALCAVSEEELITRSRYQVNLAQYRDPEVSYDAETHSWNVTWHSKDSDGYTVVNIGTIGMETTEVLGMKTE